MCGRTYIKNLKNGKATGLDGIGTRILKAGSPVLSIYLAQIFNQSLNIGYVPKCWKLKGCHLSTKVIRKLILIILDISQYYLYHTNEIF